MNLEMVIESVKVMNFKQDDVLVVKIGSNYSKETLNLFQEQLTRIIPKELNVRILFLGSDVEFEILRQEQS